MDENAADTPGAEGLSPDLSPEDLAALAAERPELWPEIAAHPNVYPDLQQWIAENSGETVVADGSTELAAVDSAGSGGFEETVVAPDGSTAVEETVVAGPGLEETVVAAPEETVVADAERTMAAPPVEETVVAPGARPWEPGDETVTAGFSGGQYGQDPAGTGGFGTDQYATDQYGTGQYATDQYVTGQYGPSPYGAGMPFDAGRAPAFGDADGHAQAYGIERSPVDPSWAPPAGPPITDTAAFATGIAGGPGGSGGPGDPGFGSAGGAAGGASPDERRKKRLMVIAGAVAGALVLGGGGTALALTETWPFGSGGPFGSEATAAADINAGPTFGAGVEEKWTFTADDLGIDGAMGGLPRMMVNYIPRSGQPQQIDGAVVLQSFASHTVRGAEASFITVLDAETGETIWEDQAESVSCVPGEGTKELICALGYEQEADLVSITEEGAFDIATVDGRYGSVHRAGAGYVLGGYGTITRVDANGAEQWSADAQEPGADSGELLQVAGDHVLGVYGESWRVLDAEGTSLLEETGLDSSNVNPEDRCDFMLTERKLLMIGTACDPSLDVEGLELEVVSEGSAMSIGLLENRANEPLMWLHSLDDMTTAYDAVTGQELWSQQGVIPGWFQEPQLVMRDGDAGDGVLLVDGETAVVAPIDGAASDRAVPVTIDGANGVDSGRMLAVVGGTILSFDEDGTVTAFDGENGGEVGLGSASDVGESLEAIGGRNGALLAIPMCVDCSTAEGSSTIHGYAFYGPVSGSGSEPEVQAAGGVSVPDFIPDCPSGTTLLAWAELEDGWVVVCGVSEEEPSYLAYQGPGTAKAVYSLGNAKPTGAQAKEAVSWDERLTRYVAELEDGSKVTLDYDMGTVTVRDSSDEKTLEQERMVRYLFVTMGDKIRTLQDASDDEGAFSVQKPKDTAEDQVRYMIEVLEKAYDGRALVKDALPKLQYCTASAGGYGDTVAAMKAVRDNRAELLESLASMPVDKIPEGEALLDDLTDAIRYSHQANVEYVAWAEAANASGCAALSPTGQSAAAASDAPKERFASRWNSAVAPKFGVRTFDAWYI